MPGTNIPGSKTCRLNDVLNPHHLLLAALFFQCSDMPPRRNGLICCSLHCIVFCWCVGISVFAVGRYLFQLCRFAASAAISTTGDICRRHRDRSGISHYHGFRIVQILSLQHHLSSDRGINSLVVIADGLPRYGILLPYLPLRMA
jgi:hypothetical protein